MKSIAICTLIGGVVFFAGLLQLGVFKQHGTVPSVVAEVEPIGKKVPQKAKFPDELAPAARAKPVAVAAPFKAAEKTHKMAFLTPGGALHSWHEGIPEAWQADYVEETELVIVVGNQKKKLLQHITYKNDAPPIDRVQYDLEVSVVEAKTGVVLDNRIFRNYPREARGGSEAWATTQIGSQVHWHTVFDWVSKKSQTGFPSDDDPYPVIVPNVD